MTAALTASDLLLPPGPSVPPDHDGLEPFCAHHRAHARPPGGMVPVRHDAGEGGAGFAARPDGEGLERLSGEEVFQGGVGFLRVQPPQSGGVADVRAVGADVEEDRPVGPAPEDDAPVSGLPEPDPGIAADIGAPQEPGEGAHGVDMEARRRRRRGPGEEAVGKHQRVLRREGEDATGLPRRCR